MDPTGESEAKGSSCGTEMPTVSTAGVRWADNVRSEVVRERPDQEAVLRIMQKWNDHYTGKNGRRKTGIC